MQLLKEHPPSPNVLPPVYAPHWEPNPDDSSKCNLCESKTMGTLVILVWFDAPSGGILSLAKCIGFSFSFPVCFWLYQKKALRKGHGRSSAASSGESQLRLGAGKPLLSHCCSSILGGRLAPHPPSQAKAEPASYLSSPQTTPALASVCISRLL